MFIPIRTKEDLRPVGGGVYYLAPKCLYKDEYK